MSSYDGVIEKAMETARDVARKRGLEMGDGEDSSPHKRLAEDCLHLKLLIPSSSSGAIIGKGGETIAEIQKNTGTKMKMSKANDYYPGTTERVLLVTGTKDAIEDVVNMVVSKIAQFMGEKRASRPEMDDGSDREKQIKLIVPNSTAGMIIGKGGAYVREMKERSGAFVQLSQKADVKLPERVITIIGEEHANRMCMEMIMDKIQADPNSGSCQVSIVNPTPEHHCRQGLDSFHCQNVSYSDAPGPVASTNMTGSPYATPSGGYGSGGFGSSGGFGAQPAAAIDTININGHTNLRLTLNVHAPTAPDPWVTSQAMPHINHALRQAGHSDTVSDELTRALGLLAAHGVLQLTQSAAPQDSSATQGWAGETGAYGYGSQAPRPQPPNPYGSKATPRPADYPAPASPPGPPGEQKAQQERVIEVEEKLVGAVLGPSGRHIVEIQQYSGTTIQISKKGVYAPGTRNRTATIKGSERGIQSAQYLIQQKIQEEEDKRVRSGRT